MWTLIQVGYCAPIAYHRLDEVKRAFAYVVQKRPHVKAGIKFGNDFLYWYPGA